MWIFKRMCLARQKITLNEEHDFVIWIAEKLQQKERQFRNNI
jgi:hypothetical protein